MENDTVLATVSTQPESDYTLDPKKLTSVPQPPMIVIHRGWWSHKITKRSVDELIEEDRKLGLDV
jgi:hypothetical protein